MKLLSRVLGIAIALFAVVSVQQESNGTNWPLHDDGLTTLVEW